jgi:hypothetical protein
MFRTSTIKHQHDQIIKKFNMKQLFFLSLSFLIAQTAFAQRESAPNYYTNSISADLNIASDGKNSLIALSAKQQFGLFGNKRFKVGYGVRLNHNFGGKSQFLTAPAILTAGKTGPIVFFDGTKIAKNMDTIQTSKFNVTSINIPLYLEYAVTDRFDVGFNIDLIGASFGASTSNYNSVHASFENFGAVAAKASGFNALLIGDNDLGSLNSEILARYHLNDKLALSAGLSFAFAEFTTDRKLYLNNDRFRQKQLMPMIGVNYRFR